MINISELSLDDMGLWPNAIKLSLVGFLMIFVIAIGYWFIVQANFDQYYILQLEEKKLKNDFEIKQRAASNLALYRNQLLDMEEHFGKLLKQLPTKNEMPGLLEDISKTGIASGLVFELFAPMPEIAHDFYIELPIKIIVRGNYHQFAVFLSIIAQMIRIVTLHDFVIALSTAASGAHASPEGILPKANNLVEQLTMEITAKIYRYRT